WFDAWRELDARPKISIPLLAGLSLDSRRFAVRQRCRRDLRAVQQLRRRLRDSAQRVAEHRLAERARRADHRRSGCHQLFHALHVDALALLFAEEHLPAAGAAAEGTLACTPRFHHLARARDHGARLLVLFLVTAQV